MLNRRQVVAGISATALATFISNEVWAAAAIKPDEASALLVDPDFG